MDQAGHALLAANLLYARAENATNGTSTANPNTESRPPIYKAIGISLAIASGVFIGISFVLKKIGLLKANEKYQEEAGEGYGYLKNAFWWSGMTLMIIGEICNFVAYAFVDAILVTPLGALSVVITTILSAIFLKERLSMVGKVGCFLCIVGSVVIVMNAPSESSAATIQEMQGFVIAPGFLGYAGAVIVGCVFIALWAGPRYGKKSMLVYLSICSLIGGLSVVATQGLGAAIVAQIGGTKQYDQWFLYVLFAFVITTLLTEIIYLNKALNIFNAALVTPTYYVFFTSATIVTSAILFRGFKGTVTSIITVVMGFFVICAGVVLLQLSKSAKDVPDAAVFAGDLDQVRTIAEQEQPETEPKADAIRGTAAIVRRFSTVRQQKEMEEAKRLHDEKQMDLLPIGENEQIEWDGLRRRRTTVGTQPSIRSVGTPFPPFEGTVHTPRHPPLGMSRFPDEEDDVENERPQTSISLFTRARSIILPNRQPSDSHPGPQSPMYPVALNEISVPAYNTDGAAGGYYSHSRPDYGQSTEYEGAAGEGRHIRIFEAGHPRTASGNSSLHLQAPTPPPHSARRQFSFQNVFRKGQASQISPQADRDHEETFPRNPIAKRGLGGRKDSNGKEPKGATEEERLGLVKGDTRSEKEEVEEHEDAYMSEGSDDFGNKYDERGLSPPRKQERDEAENYERQRRKWDAQGGGARDRYRKDEGGAFI